jgi:putative oxidoreductase
MSILATLVRRLDELGTTGRNSDKENTMGMTLSATSSEPLTAAAPVTQRAGSTGPSRKLSIALWVAQILAALIFTMAGLSKLLMPLDLLTAMSPLPGAFIRFLGVAETLGVFGLILPAALRIRPVLTPIAAACLAVIVAGATVITLAGGDVVGAALPMLTLLLTLFVAYGRTRLAPSARRA